MKTDQSVIYILILNYYGRDDTRACLDSLEKVSSESIFKVLLINNSRDEHFSDADLTKYSYRVEYIEPEKNLGFCGGNNLGIQKALSDPACGYIMLLNNDTIVTQGGIKNLRAFCDTNPDHLVSPMIAFHSTGTLQCTGGGWSLLFGYARNINKGKNPRDIREDVVPFYLNGCCICAKKEVFNTIGFFDEHYFTYGEDIDLSIRAKRCGYQLRVLKDALIYHKHSKSVNTRLKQYRICRSTVICIRKNYHPGLLFVLLPVHVMTQAVIGFSVFGIRNIFVLFKGIFAGFYDGLTGKTRNL